MATVTTIATLDATLANNTPLPKTKFGTHDVITDSEGRCEWLIEALVYDDRGTDTVKISVKSQRNPVQGVPPATRVRFKNIALQMGQFRNKQWSKLLAESVEPVK